MATTSKDTSKDAAKGPKKGDKQPKEGKPDRKRLTYLKARSKELKTEMQAIKKEAMDLRVKLGMSKKTKTRAKPAKSTAAG